MRSVELESWSDFAGAITQIRGDYGTRSRDIPGKGKIELENEILFRGQANSEWDLETTLERATSATYTVQRYLQRADSCVNEIESATGKRWNLNPYPDIVKEIESHQDFMRAHLPHYEFLVYLRHHGFPSPLLDWTTSPYVAAYFAFEQSNNAERCAIYAFIETPDGHKYGSGSATNMIHTMGPYVTTDVRHFSQKARYTIATSWDADANTRTFCSHHAVSRTSSVPQDVLIKITIPRSERITALKQLEDYNINHYTLFHTEDALIHTMGLRAFDIYGK